MPTRPLHRWKSFWLGLFVLIFLGWAWVRSTHRMDDICYKASTFSRAYAGCNGESAVQLGWWEDPFEHVGLIFNSYRFDRSRATNVWFPKAITVPGEHWQTIIVAHWFLILLFLIPWAGFLIWRIRRMRRAEEMQPSVEDRAHP